MADDAEKNPWTIRQSQVCYDNPWIAVRHEEVLKPNGEPGIYGVVHFKNLAIGVMVLDETMHTWLVGQYRYPLNRYSWEMPEGGGDPNIEPLESARRELKEETGIEAQRWDEILRLDLSNSVTDEQAIIYLARDLTYGESAPEDTEQLRLRRVPFDEAYAMVQRGEITDAMTVAAVLRVRLLQIEGQL